ncbi:3-isopropylmalate dehydrogenase [Bacillus mesophilus]|uniref:3-isopropylmalate dehydrogenase n=1 Tax=Bacillus mesophilus TaxID=1808955 RepID=A0A6M0Q843_9BACI|nr:3-isopropylmalate dehydrogenase [Bacillus mesophilus]MBM7662112.1 3-isopropylmalate dehydrogenase [Bacillus mesophilus]NEY72535.1 3-isopropylmalate dehydrogenase [Bacillus mesophilus]
MNFQIAILEGDGVGPEIVKEAVLLLNHIGEQYGHSFEFQYGKIGGLAVDEEGTPLPERTVELCKKSDAVLLGAVGGPKWDNETAERRPEAGLLQIRKELQLFANIRPVKVFETLADTSPLKEEVIKDVDFVIVRELTGGIYFGTPRERRMTENGLEVIDTLVYKESEIERILREAFELANQRNKKLTSVDKANVLESSRVWRECANTLSKHYPEVELQHMLVDNAAMQLIKNPSQFDVIVTENMFGDILSDEASVITGSIGLLPSASLGVGPSLYEPIHGSAPDIAGQNSANPLATLSSVALMLRYSLGLHQEAQDIEEAIEAVLHYGYRTKDLAGPSEKFLTTTEMGEKVRTTLTSKKVIMN